ncbi:PREDICTED: poly(A)-specific ribonuclease PARN-like domain-containing protein 1 [Elephantulus edwardii]|uniref:poly(A)-specific ribonuclease PARN-like domain-containing protein 1 n=1 Tax=Elephantulus edwardii TaxID=28737 RepID=UPI0003F0695C|nr:PREDICTED: poly(A)-specific ribonuclease PARN-like domain-containing protein 1 [Elephantulus edwardii]
MDVSAEDFERVLPLLQELVLKADFVGLDIEFTGLRSNLSEAQQISLFDLPAEWYLKTRTSVQQFTICQIGLSVFSSVSGESNKYVAHSCNFFLFPTTFGTLDSEFSFQASSVQFLNHYGFDYNKFLKSGIPYINEEEEKKIKRNILSGNWRVRSSLDKDQIKVVIDKVTRWLHLAKEGDCLTLSGITGFQATEVQLVLQQALPNVWLVLKDHEVMVKKVSQQQRWYLENTCDQESSWKEKILLSAKGFSVFFQMLVKAQKPLVGHNMMVDLLHLHQKFFRPLPVISVPDGEMGLQQEQGERAEESDLKVAAFGEEEELNFPRVFSLSEVYEVLNSDLNPTNGSGPVIVHASRFDKYVDTKCPHEAAYDAFLCGSVLLKVAHLLLQRVHGHATLEPTFHQYLDALAPYLNQVNLIRAGVPRVNFSGPDYPSIRPPILILSARKWPGLSEPQVYREFQNLCKFDVRRLTRSQFLLLTNKFKDARSVLREYRHHPDFQVSLYRYWKHSPNINCLLQVCGIVTTWALVAFVLGRPNS